VRAGFFRKNVRVVVPWLMADLQGFSGKVDVWMWCFGGEVVVKCVAYVDKKMFLSGC
jgi:hypothetical protein